MQERRASNRMDINVKIKLNVIKTQNISNLRTDEFDVDVINVSKDGLGFCTSEKLELSTFYDTTVVLWTKESFDTIIEIVRVENYGDVLNLYGCKFIGINSSDRLKIQIHEMLMERES